jgi:hypothetical protein
VTVVGGVEKFYPDAFTLGETTWGDELLIVPADRTSVPRVITRRAVRPHVQVTGTVHLSQGGDVLPGLRLKPFAGKPYVRATRIEVTNR